MIEIKINPISFRHLEFIIEMIRFAKSKKLMSVQSNKPEELTLEKTDVITLHEHPYNLIVWNDEVNTFEWVIKTLIEICKHTNEQAEQCAMLIHTQGKYAVKQGKYEELKPMCDAITERGISATVESSE